MSRKHITIAVHHLVDLARSTETARNVILTDDDGAKLLLQVAGIPTDYFPDILKQARFRINHPTDAPFTADVLVFANDDKNDEPEQEFKNVAILAPDRREWLSRLIVYAMNNHKTVQISASEELDKRLKTT